MYEWIDLELARQRREQLLREAHERQLARAAAKTQSREPTTPVLRLISLLQPQQNGVLAATKKPNVPIHGCCTD